jgi:hypothetical protein
MSTELNRYRDPNARLEASPEGFDPVAPLDPKTAEVLREVVPPQPPGRGGEEPAAPFNSITAEPSAEDVAVDDAEMLSKLRDRITTLKRRVYAKGVPDDELRMFLRLRNNDIESAAQRYVNFHTLISDYDLSRQLTPSIAKVLRLGIFRIVGVTDKFGRPVVYVIPRCIDFCVHSVADLQKAWFFAIMHVLQNYPNAQLKGVVVAGSATGMGYKHFSREFQTFVGTAINGCLPVRIGNVFMHNEHYIVTNVVFPVMKLVLKQKIVERIKFCGEDFSEIQSLVAPEHLLTEFGGKLDWDTSAWVDSLL